MEETGSADPAMRFEAAQAAGELGLKAAVQLLIPMVDDPDSNVREAAVAALGKIGGTPARRALEFLARSEDEALAQAADDALAELRFSTEALEELSPRKSVADVDDEVGSESDGEDDFEDESFDDEYDDEFADGDEYEDEYDEDEDDIDWDEDLEDEEDDGEDD
jgi:HEAT repeat protein